jgi:hypothetical protein
MSVSDVTGGIEESKAIVLCTEESVSMVDTLATGSGSGGCCLVSEADGVGALDGGTFRLKANFGLGTLWV